MARQIKLQSLISEQGFSPTYFPERFMYYVIHHGSVFHYMKIIDNDGDYLVEHILCFGGLITEPVRRSIFFEPIDEFKVLSRQVKKFLFFYLTHCL